MHALDPKNIEGRIFCHRIHYLRSREADRCVVRMRIGPFMALSCVQNFVPIIDGATVFVGAINLACYVWKRHGLGKMFLMFKLWGLKIFGKHINVCTFRVKYHNERQD